MSTKITIAGPDGALWAFLPASVTWEEIARDRYAIYCRAIGVPDDEAGRVLAEAGTAAEALRRIKVVHVERGTLPQETSRRVARQALALAGQHDPSPADIDRVAAALESLCRVVPSDGGGGE